MHGVQRKLDLRVSELCTHYSTYRMSEQRVGEKHKALLKWCKILCWACAHFM